MPQLEEEIDEKSSSNNKKVLQVEYFKFFETVILFYVCVCENPTEECFMLWQ